MKSSTRKNFAQFSEFGDLYQRYFSDKAKAERKLRTNKSLTNKILHWYVVIFYSMKNHENIIQILLTFVYYTLNIN